MLHSQHCYGSTPEVSVTSILAGPQRYGLQYARLYDRALLILIVDTDLSPTFADAEYSFVDVHYKGHAQAFGLFKISYLMSLDIAVVIALPTTRLTSAIFDLGG